nr:DNA helicase [Tanacetum cinerariifolium]
MRGKHKCDDISSKPLIPYDVRVDGDLDGDFGNVTLRQQCTRQWMQNPAASYDDNIFFNGFSGVGGPIVLDFESSGVSRPSAKEGLDNILGSYKRPQFLPKDRYDWIFRESSVAAASRRIPYCDMNTFPYSEANILEADTGIESHTTVHNSSFVFGQYNQQSTAVGTQVDTGIESHTTAHDSSFVSGQYNQQSRAKRRSGVQKRYAKRRAAGQRILGQTVVPDDTGSGNASSRGDCQWSCKHCKAKFSYGERLKGYSKDQQPHYHKCCSGGKVVLADEREPPEYIKLLFGDRNFLDHIRVYNQMFSMTSFGARVDKSINNGRGPFVFKITGQIYHWIGTLCPFVGDPLRFLQLYIYDTENEVANRMRHFGGTQSAGLNEHTVEGLMHLLDECNELVRLFKTARDKCNGQQIPDFKIRLYRVVVGFSYRDEAENARQSKMTFNEYTLGKIICPAYMMQFLGDREGYEIGSRIILPTSFTGGPQYMYSHYLNALTIFRVLGNPQYFITFTCNVNWPEIKRHMEQYPGLLPGDRADAVVRVFEQKVHDFLLYTTEFQKRGLPHCHTLLWVDNKDKIQDAKDVDRYISAELPDPKTDPEGYRIISEMIVHGPCSKADASASCIKENLCSKKFPKKFNNETYFDKNGYVYYRRRYTGVEVTRRGMDLDNSFVVLYNRQLCIAFHAHINVEYCGWSCASFEDIQTVNHKVYEMFRSACDTLGLVGDDKEWDIALEEACFSSTASELRSLTSNAFHIPNLYMNDPELEGNVLYELQAILDSHSKVVTDFGLPPLSKRLLKELKNKEMMEEKSYNREELAEEVITLVPRLNVDQKKIYDLIMNASVANRQELIFVYGHGGTGKTFLWRTIINSLRSHGKIVLTVASSLLFPSGRTAHSRFKLPLELTNESICGIKKNTHVDRTLKDIMDNPNQLFGGKSIVLGGDFRQTLPVKKCASKVEIIASSIAESELWRHFKICILRQNMRLMQPFQSEEQQNLSRVFAEWLLDIGILRMIKGESTIYKSSDEASPLKNDGGALELLYPMEYLNTLQFSGFPPHELELKVGTPIMLLRKINLQGGMCNGMRMIVKNLWSRLIEAQVITGNRMGEKIVKKPRRPAPVDYCCILIDREENAIQANMGKSDISYFSSVLLEGAAYRISKFMCTTTSNYQQTLDTETTLRFGRYTSFENIPADVFPIHYFNFTSYNQLDTKIQHQDTTTAQRQPTLTGTSATHYYFNPEIPELEDLQTHFVERLNLHPLLQISKTKFEDPAKEKGRNRYPLSTLLQQNPDSYRRSYQTNREQQALPSLPQIWMFSQAQMFRVSKKYNVPSPRDFPTEILSIKGADMPALKTAGESFGTKTGPSIPERPPQLTIVERLFRTTNNAFVNVNKVT